MKIGLIILMLFLAGCATPGAVSRALSYPQSSTKIAMPDDTYRVFEHKKDSTLMTAPSPAVAFGSGAVQGATLGIAQVAPIEQRHEAAARQYLDQTGRENCKITKGYLLAQPQYEFTYECPAGAT